jgi:excisionase family DNA binding protein
MNINRSGSQDDPWLTLAEIAEELRVNPATVRLWVSKGQLEASRAGMRKLIVRRSEVDRMLASVNRAAENPAWNRRLPARSVEPEPEPKVPVEKDRLAPRFLPPPGGENAWQLVDLAEGRVEAAFRASASAPPSAGYLDRLRAIADGFEHLSSTLFHAGQTTPTGWAGDLDMGPDRLPYELRPGGNRPSSEGLWDRFDASVMVLKQAAAETDILAVAQAFRGVADELLAVADRLAGGDAQWADSRVV